MTTLVPSTELDAVNVMLTTIGEAPVSSLEVSGLADVAIAKQVLSEINRAVQAKGWHFNTEIDYPLTPTVDGYLMPPSNTVKIDTTKQYGDKDLVLRGARLYDRKEHSYTFTDPVEVDLVVLLPFDEMPESARFYITIRAARVFQRRVLGSEAIETFTQDEEYMALSELMNADAETGDYNVLTGSYSVANILVR